MDKHSCLLALGNDLFSICFFSIRAKLVAPIFKASFTILFEKSFQKKVGASREMDMKESSKASTLKLFTP